MIGRVYIKKITREPGGAWHAAVRYRDRRCRVDCIVWQHLYYSSKAARLNADEYVHNRNLPDVLYRRNHDID